MTLLLLSLSTAHADQCSWISQAHAEAAAERLRGTTSWVAFCEPCGDAVPVKKSTGAVVAAPVSGRYWHVTIGGEAVDLAYTYIPSDREEVWYANLAGLVGCPAQLVSRKITVPLHAGQMDRVAPWLGSYRHGESRIWIRRRLDDPNGVEVQLEHRTPQREQLDHHVHAELVGYLVIDGDPPRFATPFGDCGVRVARVDGALHVSLDPACKGVLDGVAGTYRRVGD